MEEAAHKVHRLLEEQASESLLAVGYYEQNDTHQIYLSERMKEHYSEAEISDRLETAVFESLGGIAHEELHASELHATTRTFDTILDTVIPISESAGVVFALDRDGEYSYRRLITLIEEAVAEDKLGLEVPIP